MVWDRGTWTPEVPDVDAALNPDFLTQASDVVATSQPPTILTGASSLGGSVIGPPFSP